MYCGIPGKSRIFLFEMLFQSFEAITFAPSRHVNHASPKQTLNKSVTPKWCSILPRSSFSNMRRCYSFCDSITATYAVLWWTQTDTDTDTATADLDLTIHFSLQSAAHVRSRLVLETAENEMKRAIAWNVERLKLGMRLVRIHLDDHPSLKQDEVAVFVSSNPSTTITGSCINRIKRLRSF